MDQKEQARTFLAALYGNPIPDGLHINLWSGKTKKTSIIDSPSEGGSFAGRPDLYVMACLTRVQVVAGKRASAKDAAAIPGVWADLDVIGSPTDRPGKTPAPDRETALELAQEILPPTVLVNSGYGIQAWWLFEEPLLLTEEIRDTAERVSTGWQSVLRQKANEQGFTIDSTQDFARLMRLPGTYNDKGSAKQRADVVLLEGDGPRHTYEAIAAIAMEGRGHVSAGAGTAKVALDTAFPMDKFEPLRDNNETFRKTWEHTRRDREAENWSASEYDLALASMAARRNWTDDELAALIIAHRRKHLGPDDDKAQRADYIGRTVGRARALLRREDKERVVNDAMHELAALGEHEEEPPKAKAMALFNACIGGGDSRAPRFKDIIQFNSEPETIRYILITEEGMEVNVGKYAVLRNPRKLDEAIGAACKFPIDQTKDNDTWRDALRTLMRVITERSDDDEAVTQWVRRYVEDRTGGTPEAAALEEEPFEKDGYVYVKTAQLARFVKRALGERVTASDLPPLLRKAGFEQKQVHYQNRSGVDTTAMYWRITKEAL